MAYGDFFTGVYKSPLQNENAPPIGRGVSGLSPFTAIGIPACTVSKA